MLKRSMRNAFFLAGLALLGGLMSLAASAQTPDSQAAPAANEDTTAREQRLVRYLTGAKFTGQFSVDGKGFGNLKDETYTIAKCEKLPEPDAYRLTAKIKYGETDGEFPMDLKIVFAGNTPVITLDQVWIPGLGTFSSRVLVHQGRYSGTWDHDAVGGHLFGKIEPASDQASESSDTDKGESGK